MFRLRFPNARNAWRLDRRARAHAARAVAALVLARVLLHAVSYATLRALVLRVPARRAGAAGMTPLECARAIERAARLMPGTRCLARAIAAECLLRRDGHAANLSLGVSLDESRRLHAHAWLESNGTTIIGGSQAARYARLSPPPPP